MSFTPTIAAFGATGGTTLAAVVHALLAGHNVTALARTPDKLTKLLKEQSVSDDIVSKQLTVVTGNVKDVAAVKNTLTTADKDGPDVILFGIGGTPKIGLKITIDDPNVCESGVTTLLKAIEELKPAKKSLLTVVSTTGIGRKRDVPILIYPVYHAWLAQPHEDKEKMEALVRDANAKGLVHGVVVRASMLTDGAEKGISKVREGFEGFEDSSESQPVVGYTISRKDVGNWIFERVLQNVQRKELAGKSYSVTY